MCANPLTVEQCEYTEMMKNELARVLSSVTLHKAEHDSKITELLSTGTTRIAGPLYRTTTARRKGIFRLRAPLDDVPMPRVHRPTDKHRCGGE